MHRYMFKVSPEAARRFPRGDGQRKAIDWSEYEFEARWLYEAPDGSPFFWHEKLRHKVTRKKQVLYWTYDPTAYQFRRGGMPRGAEAILLYLSDLREAIKDCEPVAWCEGEKDADAWIEATGMLATSHHQGAERKATPEQAAWFKGHRGKVYLAMDLDADGTDGGNVGIADVITRYHLLLAVGLLPEQLVVVAPAEGKDIADHFAAGLTFVDLEIRADIDAMRSKAARTTCHDYADLGYANEESE